MRALVKFGIFSTAVVVCMFFSVQVLTVLKKLCNHVMSKVGESNSGREIAIQRYIFTHTRSLIAKIYRLLNNQVICLGLKRQGVTPIGFFTYWCVVAIPITVVSSWYAGIRITFTPIVYVLSVVILLFVISIRTASRVEAREDKIMQAIDMIVPDIGGGVQNAIDRYKDVLPEELREDFVAFLSRIVSTGTSFHDSMIMLSDNIGGTIFSDFAQKAIFFEESGDKESIDLFTNIVEINRLRRDLRYTNKILFDNLKSDFITASCVVWGYAFLIGFREAYTYNFMLKTTKGQILLIIDILVEILALAYMTTIKSQEL